ncbi:acyl-CoA thioesterase [Planctomycetota bacterium]
MQRTFRTTRRVEFCDTDMAGIAHFSNFFRYMEQAEHEFLRQVGKNVVLHDDRGTLGFPKLEAHCEYRHPAVLDAEMVVELIVTSDDHKTIRYECTIYQELDDDRPECEPSTANAIATKHGNRRLLAEGFLRVACCRFPPNEMPFPVPIPDHVLHAFETVKIN